jgi:uracil-DNA glycosylase
MKADWKVKLEEEFQKQYYQELTVFLDDAYLNSSVLPPRELILNAFDKCSLADLKVVIIGQDPYPTKGHAHGLSFSVEEDVSPLPKSLQNIFKELNEDLNLELPKNGNLERWAKQGVLLLNNVLTVEEGRADSHAYKGWEKFTDAVLNLINKEKENVVFLLWGKKAQEKGKLIDVNKHLILTSVHPSPLSVYRGFYGCKHFSKTNQFLSSKGLKEIEW